MTATLLERRIVQPPVDQLCHGRWDDADFTLCGEPKEWHEVAPPEMKINCIHCAAKLMYDPLYKNEVQA